MLTRTISITRRVPSLADRRASRPHDWRAFLDRLDDSVKRQHGRVDVLFANAGGGGVAPLGEISEEHFTATFDSDVKGVVFTV